MNNKTPVFDPRLFNLVDDPNFRYMWMGHLAGTGRAFSTGSTS